MGTLGGFPNPPATTPLGKAERSQRDLMRTLAGFPNPPATTPLGKAERSQRHLHAVFQLYSATSAPRRRHGRWGGRPLVGGGGQAGAVRLLHVGDLRLQLGADLLALGARPLRLLQAALAHRLDLVLPLAQLLVRVVQAGLQPLLALDRLLLVLGQLLDLLVRRHQALLEPQRALFQIAARPLVLANLVLVVQDQPLLRVQAVAKVQDVLLLAVDDLPQVQQVALLRERPLAGHLGGVLALLVQLLAQRLALGLQRGDAALQLAGAGVGGALLGLDRVLVGLQLGDLRLQLANALLARGGVGAVTLVVQDLLGQRRHLQAPPAWGPGRPRARGRPAAA